MVIPTPQAGTLKTGPLALAGLGACGDEICTEYDDSGINCLSSYIDTSGCGSSASPAPVYSPPPSSVQIPTSYDSNGNPIYSAGQTVPNVGASGPVGTATPVSSSSTTSTGMTAAQISLLNTIAGNAGTIGKELALSPGVSVSSSGAVSQQNAGFAIPGTNVSASLGSSGSSLMILLLAGAALFVFMKK